MHTSHEYVNERGYTTNNVKNFFLQFKRGMRGQRYLNEFSPLFQPLWPWRERWGTTALTMKGIE